MGVFPMSRLAIVSAVVGALLLVGTPLMWMWARPADTVGEVPVPTTSAPEQLAEEPEPLPEPDEPLVPTEPEPPVEPEEVEPAETVTAPTRLAIPGISIDAAVVDVGLEDDGAMEIPEDVSTVGWYELGVMPGETGTAVVAGHVDSSTQGRGAFFDLRNLEVDDVVTVDHEDGSTSEWRVTARTIYPKDELPIADIFTRFGDTRLVLITCGGAFDNTTRHYEDNVVVYTEPIETA